AFSLPFLRCPLEIQSYKLKAPACNRWDDANHIAIFGWRLFLAEIADVLVIQIDVYEAAQLPFFSEKVFAQFAEFHRQFAERFTDCLRRKFRGITPRRKNSQRGWDNYFDSHVFLSVVLCSISGI